MEERFPNLIAALRAACAALPDNLFLRAHLNELTLGPIEVAGPPQLRLIASGPHEHESMPLTQAV